MSRMRATLAGPVPLDVDGDGIFDSLVVPARMTRSDVLREREAELAEEALLPESSRRRGGRRRRVEEEERERDGGWDVGGSWGLRVLDLRPLRRRGGGAGTDEAEIAAHAGPFAPRTAFLSPLLPPPPPTAAAAATTTAATTTNANANAYAYPVRILPVQVPVRRARLGEEERSRQRHRKEGSPTSSSSSSSSSATGGTTAPGGGSYGKKSDIPPKGGPGDANYDRTRHYFCGRDWHHASQSCHRHCGGGSSSECGEGETCYADTPVRAEKKKEFCNVRAFPSLSLVRVGLFRPGGGDPFASPRRRLLRAFFFFSRLLFAFSSF